MPRPKNVNRLRARAGAIGNQVRWQNDVSAAETFQFRIEEEAEVQLNSEQQEDAAMQLNVAAEEEQQQEGTEGYEEEEEFAEAYQEEEGAEGYEEEEELSIGYQEVEGEEGYEEEEELSIGYQEVEGEEGYEEEEEFAEGYEEDERNASYEAVLNGPPDPRPRSHCDPRHGDGMVLEFDDDGVAVYRPFNGNLVGINQFVFCKYAKQDETGPTYETTLGSTSYNSVVVYANQNWNNIKNVVANPTLRCKGCGCGRLAYRLGYRQEPENAIALQFYVRGTILQSKVKGFFRRASDCIKINIPSDDTNSLRNVHEQP